MKMPGLACLPPISIAAAGILLLLAASAPALAQGTEEERRACTPDVMRLCREFIPSVSAITQCLIDKRAELNPDCKLVMTPKPEPTKQAAAKKRVAKRAAPQPADVARTVATSEPGAVIRPPMNILPPPEKARPVRKKKAGPSAAAARSAAAAPANPQKKPAANPQ